MKYFIISLMLLSNVFAQQFMQKPTLGSKIDFSNPLTKGLVAFWLFNEGSGDKIYDESGNFLTGTLTGMVPELDWLPGEQGYYLDFDGSGDYVSIPNPGTFFNGKYITITVWINPRTVVTFPRIVDRVYNGQFSFYINGADASYELGFAVNATVDADATNLTDAGSIILNTWQHVAITYDGETIVGYVNGVNRGTNTVPSGTLATSTSEIRIAGRADAGATRWLDGRIAQVSLYNTALSPDEINRIYMSTYELFEDRRIFIAQAPPAVTPGTKPKLAPRWW